MGTSFHQLPDRPCTLVGAAAGYGKTSTLRRLLGGAPCRWLGAAGSTLVLDLLTRALPGPEEASGLSRAGSGPLWVVLDDVGPLSNEELRSVVSDARRFGDRIRTVLVTRHARSFRGVDTWRRAGLLTVLGAADLALSRDAVAVLLRDRYGLPDPTLARAVHAGSGGWPALVHQVAQELASTGGFGPAPGEALPDDGFPRTEEYLFQEVLSAVPVDIRRFLRPAAHLDPVHAELLLPTDPARADRALRQLAYQGLLTPRPDGLGYRVVPLVAAATRRYLPLSVAQASALYRRAGAWYTGHGLPAAALRCHRLAGAEEATARLLSRQGERLLATGHAVALVAAFRCLPRPLRSQQPRLLHGDALRMVGDTDGAVDAYDGTTPGRPSGDPGVAWRRGVALFLGGDPLAAGAAFEEVGAADGGTPVDRALLAGWAACAAAVVGNVERCAALAVRALAEANVAVPTVVDGPYTDYAQPVRSRAGPADRGWCPARALAHTAAAVSARLTGDRTAAAGHLTDALRWAGNDAGIEPWVRLHRVAALSSEARYLDALAESAIAVDLAEDTGNIPFLALLLDARGGALRRLGRLDEAMECYDRSIVLHQRTGSGFVALPLAGIGDLHRLQGRESQARAAYEESIRAGETRGIVPALVPALIGLARITLRDDPSRAAELATRAVARARGSEVVAARCALGRVALAAGDPARAARTAAEAADQARLYHDRAGLAEALRLTAETAGDPELARRALAEAGAIHSDTGAVLDAAQVAVALGDVPGAGVAHRVDARLAVDRLVEAGVEPERSPGHHPAGRSSSVAVRTLGRFEVLVAGCPVPGSAWQSRKARELLRLLVIRGGQPVAREQLGDLLWSGERPDRTAHRLSVLLSIVRGVLDPERAGPADRYIRAGRGCLALNTEQVELDVALFQAEAALGLRRFERGEGDLAGPVLALAAQRYHGDFLIDDPYQDWAVPVRDEVRRLHLRVLRALAGLARRRGDLEQAAVQLGRAVEAEPYDERSHEELLEVLTAAGRYGEAERAYARYARSMAVLGLPPRSARPAPADRSPVPAGSR